MLIRVAALCAAVAVGCSDRGTEPEEPDGGETGTARLRVVHTLIAVPAVDVLVAGQVVVASLPVGTASDFVAVPAGNQLVAFRPAGSAGTPQGTLVAFTADDSTTILTVDSSSVINPWVLTDSGAVVPPGKSKLRVAHFAATAPPVDIWRTQPDFPTLITIMFPFRFREASPYLQSDPGEWTVLVTTERRDSAGVPELGDSLFATGPIVVPDGASRTVLILDRVAGGLGASIITP